MQLPGTQSGAAASHTGSADEKATTPSVNPVSFQVTRTPAHVQTYTHTQREREREREREKERERHTHPHHWEREKCARERERQRDRETDTERQRGRERGTHRFTHTRVHWFLVLYLAFYQAGQKSHMTCLPQPPCPDAIASNLPARVTCCQPCQGARVTTCSQRLVARLVVDGGTVLALCRIHGKPKRRSTKKRSGLMNNSVMQTWCTPPSWRNPLLVHDQIFSEKSYLIWEVIQLLLHVFSRPKAFA